MTNKDRLLVEPDLMLTDEEILENQYITSIESTRFLACKETAEAQLAKVQPLLTANEAKIAEQALEIEQWRKRAVVEAQRNLDNGTKREKAEDKVRELKYELQQLKSEGKGK